MAGLQVPDELEEDVGYWAIELDEARKVGNQSRVEESIRNLRRLGYDVKPIDQGTQDGTAPVNQ